MNPERDDWLSEDYAEDGASSWSADDWLYSVAEGIKLELWGLVLTVITTLACYAVCLGIIIAGGRVDLRQGELIAPFLIAFVAGQSLSFLGRLKCPPITLSPVRNRWLYVCWAFMILGLGLLWLNVFRKIPVIVQLVGFLAIMAAQISFWRFLCELSRGIEMSDEAARFRQLMVMGVSALLLLLLPQFSEFLLVLLPQVITAWVCTVSSIAMLVLVACSLSLYVYVLFRLRGRILAS